MRCATLIAAFYVYCLMKLINSRSQHSCLAVGHIIFHLQARGTFITQKENTTEKNLDVALQALIISYLGIETPRLFELTSRNELITARFWEKF